VRRDAAARVTALVDTAILNGQSSNDGNSIQQPLPTTTANNNEQVLQMQQVVQRQQTIDNLHAIMGTSTPPLRQESMSAFLGEDAFGSSTGSSDFGSNPFSIVSSFTSTGSEQDAEQRQFPSEHVRSQFSTGDKRPYLGM
jgi:hypothetical protein